MSGSQRDLPGDVITHCASLVLIRRPSDWSGEDARTVAKTALMAVNVVIPAPTFRRLVAAIHFVGRDLDPWVDLEREMPWVHSEVCDLLAQHLPPAIDGEFARPLTTDISGCVCSLRFNQPSRFDWTDQVSRALRRHGDSDLDVTLDDRFALAARIEEIVATRLGLLVQRAEELYDIELGAVESALRAAFSDRPATDPPKDSQPARAQSVRLTTEELHDIATMAGAGLRDTLAQWITGLPPIAQRAVQRKLLQLRSASPLCALSVKKIIGSRPRQLSELRVVSGGVHYRLLFTESLTANGPRIVAFGLRRDLSALIESAQRAAAE